LKSFDYPIGAHEERLRHRQAERWGIALSAPSRQSKNGWFDFLRTAGIYTLRIDCVLRRRPMHGSMTCRSTGQSARHVSNLVANREMSQALGLMLLDFDLRAPRDRVSDNVSLDQADYHESQADS